MRTAEPSPKNATDRPVLPWRIVAGAFLHFALAAYLLVGLGCCSAGLLGGMTSPELVARALPYSVRFAVVYMALATTTTLVAAMLDPLLRRHRRRRVGRDPGVLERQSRRDLTMALAEGRSRLERDAVSVLDTIASIAWHHDDPAFQFLSADLAEVVKTSVTALTTATPQRRKDLTAVTTATLARIVQSARDLQDERRRLDEGDLHTVARYIDSRYPRSDYAGDSAD